MYRIIDTHCHLDMKEFDADREDVIKRSEKNGVEAILIPSTIAEEFEKEKQLSDRFDIVYYMVGIHPHDAKTAKAENFLAAEKHLQNKKCVGIGEIGLDYYYEHSPRNIQKDVFANFIDMAIQHKMPVSIHCRDADDDLIDILKTRKDLEGVIHCFSGSEKLLKLGLDLGLYFGIGGILTFKNSTLKETIKDVPVEFVVFETDAPFLAPVPKRGKRNEPLYISYVIERMAEILQKEPQAVAETGVQNAKRVFRKIQ